MLKIKICLIFPIRLKTNMNFLNGLKLVNKPKPWFLRRYRCLCKVKEIKTNMKHTERQNFSIVCFKKIHSFTCLIFFCSPPSSFILKCLKPRTKGWEFLHSHNQRTAENRSQYSGIFAFFEDKKPNTLFKNLSFCKLDSITHSGARSPPKRDQRAPSRYSQRRPVFSKTKKLTK